jgi:hypothetical protein
MFCGECGRAVGARAAQTIHPDSGMPLHAEAADSAAQTLTAGPRDTVILEPLRDDFPELESELDALVESVDFENDHDDDGASDVETDIDGEVAGELALSDDDSPADEDSQAGTETVAEAEAEAEPDAETDSSDDDVEQDLPPEVVAEEEHEASSPAAPALTLPPEPAVSSAPQLARPDPFPWGDRGSAIFLDSDELEQTLIVPRRDTGERFVLQFSTGESVTVFGSGLLGRNPIPQPSEYFEQLVSISDPGKSVSKTHLEFGQEAGSFWVSDRFSGNGSVVREPEAAPRRLVAGKRYRIVRGTRVDIGEQFFVVS